VIYDERLERADTGKVLFDREDEGVCKIKGVLPHIGEDVSLFAAVRHAQRAGDYREKDTDPLVTHVAREISRLNKFRLVPANLARPARLPDTTVDSALEARPPRIDYNGEELAAVLYYLAEIDSPLLAEIVKRLQRVVAGFDRFDFNTVGADRIGFSLRFKDDRGVVPATNLSDGTLSLIGVLTLLMSPSRPPILLLEEPENGLTPRSTRAIYEAVVAAAGESAEPRTQVLISSHSPFVIEVAWNGDPRFIYQVKADEGRAVVRPFSEAIKEGGAFLGKVKGQRRELGLRTADEVMDGYFS
jgi:predicted ATPase